MSKSIHVNDFQWNPGKNDIEYIKLLEEARDAWKAIAQKTISKLKQQVKAQEAVEPEYIRAKDDDTGLMFTAIFCGNSDCEKQLTGHHNYCPHCGRKVKWNA